MTEKLEPCDLADELDLWAEFLINVKDMDRNSETVTTMRRAAGALRNQPADVEGLVERGEYEARIVHGGMPTDCCDYGVVSLSRGVEVCRVWREEDARTIAELLNRSALSRERDDVW